MITALEHNQHRPPQILILFVVKVQQGLYPITQNHKLCWSLTWSTFTVAIIWNINICITLWECKHLKLHFYPRMLKRNASFTPEYSWHAATWKTCIMTFNIWITKAICVEISDSFTYLINYACVWEGLMNIQRRAEEVYHLSALQGWVSLWKTICFPANQQSLRHQRTQQRLNHHIHDKPILYSGLNLGL